MPANGRFDLT